MKDGSRLVLKGVTLWRNEVGYVHEDGILDREHIMAF